MVEPITFEFTSPETILSGTQLANYQQLEEDSNANINAMNLQLIDAKRWDILSEEIATLVSLAGEQERTIQQKSLIYGKS